MKWPFTVPRSTTGCAWKWEQIWIVACSESPEISDGHYHGNSTLLHIITKRTVAENWGASLCFFESGGTELATSPPPPRFSLPGSRLNIFVFLSHGQVPSPSRSFSGSHLGLGYPVCLPYTFDSGCAPCPPFITGCLTA